MSAVTTMTEVSGWFKNSYVDKVVDLIPDEVYYAKECKPMPASAKTGGKVYVPVNVSSEQGITMAAAGAGAFSLNSVVSMSSKQAEVDPSQLLLRSALDYETIFRSKSQNAFVTATKGVIENMLKSMYFYIESEIMYGKTGVGVVSAINGLVVDITAASFAPGLWLGSEGRSIKFQTAGGVNVGDAVITGYDLENKTITIDADPGVAGTNVIYFKASGLSGANSMVGLYSAMSATTGTLWGLDKATYGLWRGAGTYSAGSAPLSFNKIMKAIAKASNRGMGAIAEIECVVSASTWSDLGNDLAALRQLDSSYKSAEANNGSEKITFFCPAGKVSIFTHKLMKEGIAFVHPKAARAFELVGAQPTPTFELPGMTASGEKQYLKPMDANAGVETRLYANLAVFTSKVNQTIVITDIVNAA
jgi:hypothetical protein